MKVFFWMKVLWRLLPYLPDFMVKWCYDFFGDPALVALAGKFVIRCSGFFLLFSSHRTVDYVQALAFTCFNDPFVHYFGWTPFSAIVFVIVYLVLHLILFVLWVYAVFDSMENKVHFSFLIMLQFFFLLMAAGEFLIFVYAGGELFFVFPEFFPDGGAFIVCQMTTSLYYYHMNGMVISISRLMMAAICFVFIYSNHLKEMYEYCTCWPNLVWVYPLIFFFVFWVFVTTFMFF